ncbi:hypothetical protein ABFS82_08G038600 [Erythranthe guttata]|uniref:Uncharacterized protein n=1 Tax=Erythranthe guttata TaxID=4155 RepID=A0A022RWD9_ERYGU|nr:hypothetical protein MIMGU_mgv1a022715mg [Erythranthe guttata]
MVMMGLEKLMTSLKSKIKGIKKRKQEPDYYNKIDKSESMRVEIRSRKARKLIQDTLKIADSPKTRSYV